MTYNETMPPHDTTAEEAVLGSILISGEEAMVEVRDFLTAEDFYHQRHAILFTAMQEVFHGPTILDVVTLDAHLSAKGVLESVGGYPYLSRLQEVPSYSGYARHYARIVREHSVRRKALTLASQLATEAAKSIAPVTDLLDEIERQLYSLRQSSVGREEVTLGEAVDAFLSEVGPEGGEPVQTGFIDLDATIGGLYPGQMCVVAAPTSQGKSAFAHQVSLRAVQAMQKGVLIVSEEMRAEEVAGRYLGSESGVPMAVMRRWKTLMAHQEAAVMAAAGTLAEFPIVIEDRPVDVLGIRGAAKRVQMRFGLALIVVDYLQLVDSSLPGRATRTEQVTHISRSLKRLAGELKVPVIALSQFNREQNDTQEPELRHLRESGAIEQDADVVLLMWRPEKDNESVTEVVVAKNRNGPRNHVRLFFDGPRTMFRDLEARR